MHTIDPDFILGISRISEFGARKYHMRNFLMAPGMAWSSVYGSLMRHLLAWWKGEDLDEESGLPHLLHAAWNIMALYTYWNHDVYRPGDDRPSTLEYAGKSWKEWEQQFNALRSVPAAAGSDDTPDRIVAEMRERLKKAGYSGSVELHENRITISINPHDLQRKG